MNNMTDSNQSSDSQVHEPGSQGVNRRTSNRVCPLGSLGYSANRWCVVASPILSIHVLRPSVIVMQKIRYRKLPS
jgi:hypothetical protein